MYPSALYDCRVVGEEHSLLILIHSHCKQERGRKYIPNAATVHAEYLKMSAKSHGIQFPTSTTSFRPLSNEFGSCEFQSFSGRWHLQKGSLNMARYWISLSKRRSICTSSKVLDEDRYRLDRLHGIQYIYIYICYQLSAFTRHERFTATIVSKSFSSGIDHITWNFPP